MGFENKKSITHLGRKIIAMPGRLFRKGLFYVFGFDKWHINTRWDRKYPDDIIKYLNARPKEQRGSLIEIGCGLGDMIRNLKYERRFGYDIEENVLKAARFLTTIKSNGNIVFQVFRFPESPLTEKVDVIIMVNWIHNIPPGVLKEKVTEYFQNNLEVDGALIVDTVSDTEYQFNHEIGFLTSGLKCSLKKIGSDQRGREIFSIGKIKE